MLGVSFSARTLLFGRQEGYPTLLHDPKGSLLEQNGSGRLLGNLLMRFHLENDQLEVLEVDL